jgi:uncharacterized protein YoxC
MQKKIVVIVILIIAIALIAFEIWFSNRQIKRIDKKMHHVSTVTGNRNGWHHHIT